MSYRLGVANIYELLDDENEKEGSRVAAQITKQEASKVISTTKPTTPTSTQAKPKTSSQTGPRRGNHIDMNVILQMSCLIRVAYAPGLLDS